MQIMKLEGSFSESYVDIDPIIGSQEKWGNKEYLKKQQ
jgi:hypothetical protein